MRIHIQRILNFIAASVTMLVAISLLAPGDVAKAGATQNIQGWAWSDTVGWISFNNFTDGSGIDYGVNVDQGGSGDFSGYAWNENIGWIDFAPSGPYPEAPNHAARLEGSGVVTGWARAIAGAAANDGWDGWIKMSDESDPFWVGTGVRLAGDTFEGYAWGSDVIGWIDFAADLTGGGGGGGGGSCSGVCVTGVITECNDGVDNADPEDMLIDMMDPGCSDPLDNDETDPVSAVSVAISSNPSSITLGESTLVTWVVSGANSCTASGSWTGSKSASGGAQSLTPTSSGNKTYILECTDGVDIASDSTGVSVASPPSPSFSLVASGSTDVSIVSGGSGGDSSTISITAVPSGGFADNIALSVVGVSPNMSGITYNITDNTLTSSEYAAGTAFSAQVPSTASAGTYSITLQGVGGGLTRTVNITLNVEKKDPGYWEY